MNVLVCGGGRDSTLSTYRLIPTLHSNSPVPFRACIFAPAIFSHVFVIWPKPLKLWQQEYNNITRSTAHNRDYRAAAKYLSQEIPNPMVLRCILDLSILRTLSKNPAENVAHVLAI